jgi:hypothetical protein
MQAILTNPQSLRQTVEYTKTITALTKFNWHNLMKFAILLFWLSGELNKYLQIY